MTGAFVQEMTFNDSPLDGYAEGTYVETTANGDKLWGAFTVRFISETDFVGTWTAENGTGRFQGVAGRGTSSGKLNPDLTFEYNYTGYIRNVHAPTP